VSALDGLAPRRPPANLEAEQALLGAILANPRAHGAVAQFLRAEHFADPLHGRIYAECERRILVGRVADGVSLRVWIEADPDGAGIPANETGATYIAQLLASHVGIGNACEYGRVIREAWQRRRLIEIGEELATRAYGQEEPSDELLIASLAMIESAFDAESDRPGVTLDVAMDTALRAADEAARKQGPAGISTGFRAIDDQIDGLEPDSLHVLAGRPGMGKSSLGWQIAVAAARAGQGVLAVSLEMSATELGRRALSAAAGVPVRHIKRGYLGGGTAECLVQARRELGELPLTIEDGSGLAMAQIDLKARGARRRHKLGLILVDHLHIIRPEDRDLRQGATWAVGRISGAMKRLAKQHRCPVLLLAQLNRGVEAREDKRPGLSDLRQAGDIEQDADTVSFLYRPEYYLRDAPERREAESSERFEGRLADWHGRREQVRGKAELIVAKVRDGATGIVPLRFHAETASFSEAPQ